MLRIHNVKVKLGKMDERKIVSQVLNVREKAIRNVQLSKQSIDARRQNVHWICSFDFEVDDEDAFIKTHPQVQKLNHISMFINKQMIKKLSLSEVDQRACFVLIRLLVQGRMLQS